MQKSNLTLLSLLLLVLLTSACSNTSFKKLNTKLDEVLTQKKAEEPAEPPPSPLPPPPPPAVRKAVQDLNSGIRSYEDGNYNTAAGYFQNALGDGQLTLGEQVTAHKYLAFIYCVSGEKLACRGEFKKVLTLNPKFELSAGEAGHPMWGPVFREVQAAATGRKIRKN
ncbi:MAG: TssQ family T6SS-associated lipoprotein [Sulfurimicrobium sp.]|nr:TssQ family T6SS-associated lipoprotein [Sulfurimicrobium sp.]